jgi:hypothetical protein
MYVTIPRSLRVCAWIDFSVKKGAQPRFWPEGEGGGSRINKITAFLYLFVEKLLITAYDNKTTADGNTDYGRCGSCFYYRTKKTFVSMKNIHFGTQCDQKYYHDIKRCHAVCVSEQYYCVWARKWNLALFNTSVIDGKCSASCPDAFTHSKAFSAAIRHKIWCILCITVQHLVKLCYKMKGSVHWREGLANLSNAVKL